MMNIKLGSSAKPAVPSALESPLPKQRSSMSPTERRFDKQLLRKLIQGKEKQQEIEAEEAIDRLEQLEAKLHEVIKDTDEAWKWMRTKITELCQAIGCSSSTRMSEIEKPDDLMDLVTQYDNKNGELGLQDFRKRLRHLALWEFLILLEKARKKVEKHKVDIKCARWAEENKLLEILDLRSSNKGTLRNLDLIGRRQNCILNAKMLLETIEQVVNSTEFCLKSIKRQIESAQDISFDYLTSLFLNPLLDQDGRAQKTGPMFRQIKPIFAIVLKSQLSPHEIWLGNLKLARNKLQVTLDGCDGVGGSTTALEPAGNVIPESKGKDNGYTPSQISIAKVTSAPTQLETQKATKERRKRRMVFIVSSDESE